MDLKPCSFAIRPMCQVHRYEPKQYVHEMDEAQHEQLLDLLLSVRVE